MRGFTGNRYEPNPSKFDKYRVFFPFFKNEKYDTKMIHFPTFSQSPSPLWHPSQSLRPLFPRSLALARSAFGLWWGGLRPPTPLCES